MTPIKFIFCSLLLIKFLYYKLLSSSCISRDSYQVPCLVKCFQEKLKDTLCVSQICSPGLQGLSPVNNNNVLTCVHESVYVPAMHKAALIQELSTASSSRSHHRRMDLQGYRKLLDCVKLENRVSLNLVRACLHF